MITCTLTFVISPLYSPHHDILQRHTHFTRLFALFISYPLILHFLNLESLQLTVIIHIMLIVLVITAAIFDGMYMIIPDRLLLVFLPSLIILQVLNGHVLKGIAGGAFAFGLLLLIAVISKGGIGGGDIKLFTVIGLGTSFTFIYLLLLFSCFFAFIIGLISRVSGKRRKKEMVPFGPTIAMVTILLICYSSIVQEGIA